MSQRIIVGDVLDVLPTLPAASVHCVVSSPPYWNLRDYGTAAWNGGDSECDHSPVRQPRTDRDRSGLTGSLTYVAAQEPTYRDTCGKCGATRTDRQIGREPTVGAYVETMVRVFREVWRVLRDDGSLWLNLGDSYAGSWGAQSRGHETPGTLEGGSMLSARQIAAHPRGTRTGTIRDAGLKPKDLMMIPARVALALQADGWYLRSEITWIKTAPMPESVTDRPTQATEKVFLLTKQPRYFYDAEAVKEGVAESTVSRLAQDVASQEGSWRANGGAKTNGTMKAVGGTTGRNMRNAWIIGPAPFAAAHFATFPPEIPRRAILAGTSERGCCPACGAPWRRVVEQDPCDKESRIADGEVWGPMNLRGAKAHKAGGFDKYSGERRVLGWQPTCTCDAGDPIPATILDPFAGAGTSLLVADRLGRHGIGIELNPSYAELARTRIANDAPMLTTVAVEPAQTDLFAAAGVPTP